MRFENALLFMLGFLALHFLFEMAGLIFKML